MEQNKSYVFDFSERVFLRYLDNPNKEDYENLEFDACTMNSASSFYFLAYILYYAIGVERDVFLAMTYLEQAIKNSGEIKESDARIYRAHEMLAWVYESGDIIPEYDKAFSLYLEGIKNDNPRFSYERLGFLSYWGRGCEQNYLNAIHYFVEAATRGSVLAHYYLGTMYRDGDGVQQSTSKAVEHFEIAAKGENEDAISCLAYMYSKYYDEWETDFRKSMSYYEKLTQMESPRAQRMGWYGIGYTYIELENMDKYNFGINCLKKAAELGSEQAIDLLNSL